MSPDKNMNVHTYNFPPEKDNEVPKIMYKPKISLVFFIFIYLIISPHLTYAAKNASTPPGKMSYEDRIQFVQTLLEKSSATKQIDSSGNPDAIAHRQKAMDHFENAKQKYATGDIDAANNELIESTKIMFEAVRLAKKDDITYEKKKRDYQNRLDSINALMEAHDRVTQEKGKHSDGIELRQIVAEKVKKANSLLNNNKIDEARSILDEAYVAAKIAINTLRGGDTLVRTLHFETKEEEYHYEIDRNDTHKMLLQIMEKKTGSKTDMKTSFLDKAEQLRKEAEQKALKSDYETAIQLLEESTKNLVRALRSSGIYIPG